jgi:hypothetical protein
VFLDPSNHVLSAALRKRFEDPTGKDFEKQIVADFDGVDNACLFALVVCGSGRDASVRRRLRCVSDQVACFAWSRTVRSRSSSSSPFAFRASRSCKRTHSLLSR